MKYFLRADKKKGDAGLYCQVYSSKHAINRVKLATGVKVDVKEWTKAMSSPKGYKTYSESEDGKKVIETLNLIDSAVALLFEKDVVTIDDVRSTILNVVCREEKQKQDTQKAEDEKEKAEASKKVLVLCGKFIEGITAREILTKGGSVYSDSTISIYLHFRGILTEFLKKNKLQNIKFDEITITTVNKFTKFLNDKGMMLNTQNKMRNCFRKLCYYALDLKLCTDISVCRLWENHSANEKEVRTEIFLDDTEINCLYSMQLSDKEMQQVRDVFVLSTLVGQRFSDMVAIDSDCFYSDCGVLYCRLTQKKTKTDVIIPITDNIALEICEKYDYNLPEIAIQKFNKTIKEICKRAVSVCPSFGDMFVTQLTAKEIQAEENYKRLAGLKESGVKLTENERKNLQKLSVAVSNYGGINGNIFQRNSKGQVIRPKWSLVSSHTGRRSFDTNAMNEGILTSQETMTVTGHKSEKIFQHYDKTQAEMRARMIAAKLLNKKGKAKNVELKIAK